MQKPVVLCILDGWGERENAADNGISAAKTPNWDRYKKTCPATLLDASEEHVGLPSGQMGNSEVGHTNIGAGRIVLQDLPRIDQSVESGDLHDHPLIQQTIEELRTSGKCLHLMGLLSPGGVHSHMTHIFSLLKIFSHAEIPVFLHAWLDGRDTPPKSAHEYLKTTLEKLDALPNTFLATISGRFYAMDRDKRWDRVEKMYRALQKENTPNSENPLATLEEFYAQDITDEFVPPFTCEGFDGIEEGDAFIIANFRADRVREIITTLVDPKFKEFKTTPLNFSKMIGMTSYSEELDKKLEILFPPQNLKNTLGEVLAKHGKKQLRIAETEKYAHVTFFFNGGREDEFKGEERTLIPSPKVKTYDEKPEMSAHEVTKSLVASLKKKKFDFVALNYANPDMVGHTGNLPATIKAIETVDTCLGELEQTLKEVGGILLITADHGNAEMMQDPKTGEPHTAHTCNKVPFVIVNALKQLTLKEGMLSDIAPTILSLLDVKKPNEMTGICLIN